MLKFSSNDNVHVEADDTRQYKNLRLELHYSENSLASVISMADLHKKNRARFLFLQLILVFMLMQEN